MVVYFLHFLLFHHSRWILGCATQVLALVGVRKLMDFIFAQRELALLDDLMPEQTRRKNDDEAASATQRKKSIEVWRFFFILKFSSILLELRTLFGCGPKRKKFGNWIMKKKRRTNSPIQRRRHIGTIRPKIFFSHTNFAQFHFVLWHEKVLITYERGTINRLMSKEIDENWNVACLEEKACCLSSFFFVILRCPGHFSKSQLNSRQIWVAPAHFFFFLTFFQIQKIHVFLRLNSFKNYIKSKNIKILI